MDKRGFNSSDIRRYKIDPTYVHLILHEKLLTQALNIHIDFSCNLCLIFIADEVSRDAHSVDQDQNVGERGDERAE